MEDEDSADFARVDYWVQSTVPSIPRSMAIFCLVLNIVVPGSGTVTGGLVSCCCGRPRYEFRPAKFRCPTSALVIIIGFAQFVSTVFMLVGWLWSIIWGVLMVNLSGEEFRKTPSPPPDPKTVRREQNSEANKNNMDTTAEDEFDSSMPRGKRNFLRLVAKAGENKELAMYGPPPSSLSDAIIPDLKRHFMSNLMSGSPKTSSGKSLSFINGSSTSPPPPTVSATVAKEAEDGTPTGSLSSKYSIFGCFRGQESNSVLHEKFIRMMKTGKDAIFPHPFPAEDSPTFSLFRARSEEVWGRVQRFFNRWKNQTSKKNLWRATRVDNTDDDPERLESVTVISNSQGEGRSSDHRLASEEAERRLRLVDEDDGSMTNGGHEQQQQEQQLVTSSSPIPSTSVVQPGGRKGSINRLVRLTADKPATNKIKQLPANQRKLVRNVTRLAATVSSHSKLKK